MTASIYSQNKNIKHIIISRSAVGIVVKVGEWRNISNLESIKNNYLHHM